jgi:hypothetical protein
LYDNYIRSIEEQTKRLIPWWGAIYIFSILAGLGVFSAYSMAQADTLTGTVPLVIDAVAVSRISTTSSIISWMTNGDATSQVLYDTASHVETDNYTFTSILDSIPVSSHVVILTGLSAQKTYYFRVRSITGDLTAISNENSFTTSIGEGGGVNGGTGGGGGAPTCPGVTNLGPYINNEGVFNLEYSGYSEDKQVSILFARGVQGTKKDGAVLKSVIIVPLEKTPPLPDDRTSILSLAYEFGPAGAKFMPGVDVTIAYNPAKLPAGFKDGKLAIALWNPTTKAWEKVEGGKVDAQVNTMTVTLTHFSIYAVIAEIQPASLSLDSVSISPLQANVGEKVNIRGIVSNSGDLLGYYSVVLKVNGKTESTQNIPVAGNSQQSVDFNVMRDEPGTYEVDVNGRSGAFTVLKTEGETRFTLDTPTATPVEVKCGGEVHICIVVKNSGGAAGTYTVDFKIDNVIVDTQEVNLAADSQKTVECTVYSGDIGQHLVNVNGRETSFTVLPPAPPPNTISINWWLIGTLIIQGVVISSALIFLIKKRKKDIPSIPPTARPG